MSHAHSHRIEAPKTTPKMPISPHKTRRQAADAAQARAEEKARLEYEQSHIVTRRRRAVLSQAKTKAMAPPQNGTKGYVLRIVHWRWIIICRAVCHSTVRKNKKK